MKTKTKNILSIMHVIMWIVFIGTCIKTGAILYSFFVSLVINAIAAKDLHLGLNLSELYQYNSSHYIGMVSFVICLYALRAYITYLVIKIFLKINLVNPFSNDVASLIKKISGVAFLIGILTIVANSYSNWLMKREIPLNNLHEYLQGKAEFLFMAGIVFIIAQVFKRGIEIQSENELTV